MSLRSLNEIAIERDVRPPRKKVSGTKRAPAALEPGDDETTKAKDALVSAIPTEVLAPYTALVGGIVATIDANESDRLLMRWVMYGGAILFIVVFLGWAYARQKKAQGARKFPWAETIAAVVAFAAWGLVMPGSPLSVRLTGDDLVVWTLIITIVGAAVVGLIANGSLKKQVGG